MHINILKFYVFKITEFDGRKTKRLLENKSTTTA